MGTGVEAIDFGGLREKPTLFVCGVLLLIFYTSPVFFFTTVNISFPDLCENGSCQLEPSQGGMVLSVRDVEINPNYLYLVNTSGCKLMDMDPFDTSVTKFLNKSTPTQGCNRRNVKVEGEKLVIDEEFPGAMGLASVNCCHTAIYRMEQTPEQYTMFADWKTRYSNVCIEIPPEGSSVRDSAFVKVECSGTNGAGEVNKNVEFHGIPLHPKRHSEVTRTKAEFWDKRRSMGMEKPPSILVIGIDSTSRLHMIRSLPKTREFLLQNDFVELKGYNKVGDNTFPNIMAGFAGMELDNYSSCWPNKHSKLDDCPLIWKNFSKLNYLTGLFEDSPAIAIFNFLKVGFVLPPADYYMRPLEIAIYKYFTNTPQEHCVGGVNVTEFTAKFIKELVVKMGRDYPYFFFSWLTSISHDDYDGLGTVDETFLNLFQTAMDNSTGDPDNTVVIFMSDHGYRYGGIRETLIGFYEDSLPFFYFRLPPSMKRKNPEWYSNLRRNSNQLTSPLDLHSTLVQILAVAQTTLASNSSTPPSDLRQNKNQQFDKQRYSFFERIHDNRTCEISSIPLRYCMCGVTPESRIESELSVQFGEIVISNINSLLEADYDKCRTLSFHKFLYGRKLVSGQLWNTFGQVFNYMDYLVALEAYPGLGHFESKIRIFQNSSKQILGDIERINSYEGQSDCIEDSRLKNYCFCKWKSRRHRNRMKNFGRVIIPIHYLEIVIMVMIIIKAS